MTDLNKCTYDEIIKMSKDSSLDSDAKIQVENYLNETKYKIENLEYIDKLGLELKNSGSNLILRRSNSGKKIDFLAVFIGFISFPILGLGLGMFFFKIYNNKISLNELIPAIILLAIGGVLFALFLKGWERRFMFAGFSFEKNSLDFKLKQMSNFIIKETNFNIDSKLSLIQKEEINIVVLSKNGIDQTLFYLPKLGSIQSETLKALINKFN